MLAKFFFFNSAFIFNYRYTRLQTCGRYLVLLAKPIRVIRPAVTATPMAPLGSPIRSSNLPRSLQRGVPTCLECIVFFFNKSGPRQHTLCRNWQRPMKRTLRILYAFKSSLITSDLLPATSGEGGVHCVSPEKAGNDF